MKGDGTGAALRQWPAAKGVAIEGPLAHVGLAELASAAPARGAGAGASGAATRFRALPVSGMRTLRGDAARPAFADTVRSATGLALPAALGTSAADGADSPPGAGRVLRWRSPDEWLLSCPIDEAADIVAALEAGFDAACCVVDVSGGYALFELDGRGMEDTLRRSTAYDAAVDLPPGKVVSTTFAKAAVMLRRIDGARVELVVRRSFADYVWTWLQRAAGAGGLELAPFEERIAG